MTNADEKTTDTIGKLVAMDPFDFERLIAQLLKKMGMHVERTKSTGDGGIDLLANSSQPLVGGLFVVQCKRYAPENKVDVSAIRDLFGVMTSERASKGIVVTTSSFTKQSTDFASGKPLELIDGEHLVQLLNEFGIVDESAPTSAEDVAPRPIRQLNASLMAIRDRIDETLVKDRLRVKAGKRAASFERWKNDLLSGEVLTIYVEATDSIATILSGICNSERWADCGDSLEEFVRMRTQILVESTDAVLSAFVKVQDTRVTSVHPDWEEYVKAMKDSFARMLKDYLVAFSAFATDWLREFKRSCSGNRLHIEVVFDFDPDARIAQLQEEMQDLHARYGIPLEGS